MDTTQWDSTFRFMQSSCTAAADDVISKDAQPEEPKYPASYRSNEVTHIVLQTLLPAEATANTQLGQDGPARKKPIPNQTFDQRQRDCAARTIKSILTMPPKLES